MSKLTYNKTCEQCGEPFVAKSAKGKYCSPNCRQKYFAGKKNNTSDDTLERLALLRAELEKPSHDTDCPECKKRGVPFYCFRCGRTVTKCYDTFELKGEKICLWCWCKPPADGRSRRKQSAHPSTFQGKVG